MPVHSYTTFFENLLDHPNIEVKLGVEALDHLKVKEDRLWVDGQAVNTPVVYTGALDELFGCVYGKLPYRSLRFEWKYTEQGSLQQTPIKVFNFSFATSIFQVKNRFVVMKENIKPAVVYAFSVWEVFEIFYLLRTFLTR